MTPKEKAQDLVNKFRLSAIFTDSYVKAIAKTAVDEILESLGYKKLSDSPYTTLEARQYYVQVKQEIENL
jgi:hypothetical protein